MTLLGWKAVDVQLVMAGLFAAVAIEQAWATVWDRSQRPSRWAAVCGAVLAVQVGANALVLQLHDRPEVAVPLFWRFVAASVLPVAAVLLTAALVTQPVSPVVLGLCAGGALLRLLLWPTTDLVFAHRLDGGWPAYGPLPPFLTLPFVALSVGYIVVVVRRYGSDIELTALLAGAAATMAVTVLDFLWQQPALDEELSGWVTVPLFGVLLVVAGRRRVLEAADRLATAEEARYRATHDELTGLMNRAELMRAMTQERVDLSGALVVLHVGLDAVRSVNDSFGHHVGDRLLAETAARLDRLTPAAALVARIAGDEFVVVTETDEDRVEDAGARLLTALTEPYELGPFSGPVTASVGVASRRRGEAAGDPESLLHDADIAMHRVKEGGGRGLAHFDDWMRAELLRTRGLERRLAKALGRDEVCLNYEPIVSLESRQPIAYEGLARWTCDGERMAAAEWIAVAESSGHIIEIGAHLARSAMTQARAWQAAGEQVALSLNVSARQLRTPDLVRLLDEAVDEGLDAPRVWLEITESVAVDDVAVQTLKSLRDKGFRIALDDFGTGYSSLHAIGRLPIDIVKIDRSFVVGLRQNGNKALVAAVISIAEAHCLEVVAEGIETEERARDLLELGCGWGQGYLFGRAAPASTLALQVRR